MPFPCLLWTQLTIALDVRLSIQQIFWQQMLVDLNITYTQLNQSMSVNFVGLAVGCVLYIPWAKKYGRRPVYIASTAIMLATSFWTARLETLTELYIANLLQGLAGATNETIAEITVRVLLTVSWSLSLTLHRSPTCSSCIIEALRMVSI